MCAERPSPRNFLTSPVSKTPCCFYRVEIEHWKEEDRGGSWKHWCTDADGYKFYLTDGTGRILVDAHAADYDLPQVVERKVNSESTSSLVSASGASDADLLTYVNTARVHSMLGTASTWLEKKLDQKLEQQSGSLDPRKEQGMLALKEFLHTIPEVQKTGNLRMEALEKVMNASGPLADPEREARRQQALERLRMMGGVKAVPELQAQLATAARHRRIPAARVRDPARAGILRERHLQRKHGGSGFIGSERDSQRRKRADVSHL